MEQTVYLDLFFMINFSMDFLCFYLTSKLLGIKMSLLRALIASVLGGIYACLALFMNIGGIGALALDALSGVIMCAVCFGIFGKWRQIPVYILVYVAVSMTLGGFMTALFNLLNRTALGNISLSEDSISVWLLAILAIVSAILTLCGGRFFRRKTSKKNVSIKICFEGKSCELSALCDSGNMLREPISGRLCVIVNIGALRGVVPNGVLMLAKQGSKSIEGIIEEYPSVRFVPTKTATGVSMLYAIKPESVSVTDGKREYCVDAYVALSELSLPDGADALFPTELLM